MSKIGVLTFHHVANWGSAMQAFCLHRLLTRLHPNSRVEIINYIPETSAKYSEKRIGSVKGRRQRWWSSPVVGHYEAKLRACDRFLRKRCLFSDEQLCSDDLAEGQRFLDRQHYDAVFVGSDTVFQLGSNFGGTYISAPQAPSLYFLPFETSYAKIAFAASANPFHDNQFDSLDRSRTLESLRDFDLISYRDEATRSALTSLGLEMADLEFMPDPTILVDFDTILDEHGASRPRRRRAGVAIGNSKLANSAIATLVEKDYEVINLLNGKSINSDSCDRDYDSVEQYLDVFRSLSLCVTDRFHGSIFTFGVSDCPVIGIEESERYPEPNSKVRDLYRRLDLEPMILRVTGNSFETDWLDERLEWWCVEHSDLVGRFVGLRNQAYQSSRVLQWRASTSQSNV